MRIEKNSSLSDGEELLHLLLVGVNVLVQKEAEDDPVHLVVVGLEELLDRLQRHRTCLLRRVAVDAGADAGEGLEEEKLYSEKNYQNHQLPGRLTIVLRLFFTMMSKQVV